MFEIRYITLPVKRYHNLVLLFQNSHVSEKSWGDKRYFTDAETTSNITIV
jgi:hypothetical protein